MSIYTYPCGSGWPCAVGRWGRPCGTPGCRPAAARTAHHVHSVSPQLAAEATECINKRMYRYKRGVNFVCNLRRSCTLLHRHSTGVSAAPIARGRRCNVPFSTAWFPKPHALKAMDTRIGYGSYPNSRGGDSNVQGLEAEVPLPVVDGKGACHGDRSFHTKNALSPGPEPVPFLHDKPYTCCRATLRTSGHLNTDMQSGGIRLRKLAGSERHQWRSYSRTIFSTPSERAIFVGFSVRLCRSGPLTASTYKLTCHQQSDRAPWADLTPCVVARSSHQRPGQTWLTAGA